MHGTRDCTPCCRARAQAMLDGNRTTARRGVFHVLDRCSCGQLAGCTVRPPPVAIAVRATVALTSLYRWHGTDLFRKHPLIHTKVQVDLFLGHDPDK